LVGAVERARLNGDVREGDVLLSADGEPVSRAEDVLAAIAAAKPRTRLKLELWRERNLQSVTVEVNALAATAGSATARLGQALGIGVEPLSEDKRQELAVGGDYWVDEKQKQAQLTEVGTSASRS